MTLRRVWIDRTVTGKGDKGGESGKNAKKRKKRKKVLTFGWGFVKITERLRERIEPKGFESRT